MTVDQNLNHPGEIIAESSDGIIVINCKKCGFIHQMPIPEEIERDKYYEDNYFQQTKSEYYNKQKLDIEFLEAEFKKKEKFLRQNLSSLPLTILDIGTGSGQFINYFYKNGWITKGIEPNKLVCDLIKKEFDLDVFPGTYNQFIDSSNEKYSVVHLSFVLEHLVDPISFLKSICENVLSPEGLICIQVPNDFNPLQDIIYSKLNNNWWVCRDHVNYYNNDTLCRLLKNLGFEIITSYIAFPIEFFILMGDDYITYPEVGRDSHLRIVNFEKNLENYNKELKNKLYNCFLELNIGRNITIIARIKNE